MHGTADQQWTTTGAATFTYRNTHCIMPTFTPEQHTMEVRDELTEAVQKLSKRARTRVVKELEKKLAAIQGTKKHPASKGDNERRVGNTPEVTSVG